MLRTLSKTMVPVLLFSLWTPVFSGHDIARASTDVQKEPAASYLIKFKDEEIGKAHLEQMQKKIGKSYRHLSAHVVSELTEREAQELGADPNVQVIEKDQPIRIMSVPASAHLEQINQLVMLEQGVDGQGVKVAVLDTGIDTEATGLKLSGGISFVPEEGTYDDANGHGTHVAGILAAQANGHGFAGVAPGADLYAVKVLNAAGQGSYSQVLAGIDWAMENGMDIVSMSFTGDTHSVVLEEAMQDAYQQGVLLVAAAGNEGAGHGVAYPAAFDAVVAVGAVDGENRVADFSNRGPELDLVAPGVDITGLSLNGEAVTRSGTSMAVPQVAGVAALLLSRTPEATAQEIRQQLAESAIPLGDPNEYGKGLVNATGVKTESHKYEKDPKWATEQQLSAELEARSVHVNSRLDKLHRELARDEQAALHTAREMLQEEEPALQGYAVDVIRAFGSSSDAQALRELLNGALAPDVGERAETAYYELMLADLDPAQSPVSLFQEALSGKNRQTIRFVLTEAEKWLALHPDDAEVRDLLASAEELKKAHQVPDAAERAGKKEGKGKAVQGDKVTVAFPMKPAKKQMQVFISHSYTPSVAVQESLFTTDPSGQLQVEWQTLPNTPPGLYRISVREGNGAFDEASGYFVFVAPSEEAEVATAEETMTIDGPTMTFATADTYEPNNTMTEAYPVEMNSGYTSYIFQYGDNDYYRFTPSSTGTLALTLAVPGDKDYDIQVKNASGVTIAGSYAVTGYAENFSVAVNANETYYIYVYGYANAYSATGSYTLTLGSVNIDTYEPNNATYQAYTVTPGSGYVSYISQSTDRDYYQFTPTVSATIKITLSVPSDKDYNLQVLDASGRLLKGSYGGTGLTETVLTGVSANQTYRIYVYGNGGQYGTSPYTLTLGALYPDAMEPNDSLSLGYPVTTASSFTGYISQTGDPDYYKFTAATSGIVNVTMSVPSDKDYDIKALTSGGSTISGSYRGTGGYESFQFSVTANQTYYIYVWGFGGASGPNPYTVGVSSIALDTYELNNSSSTAYPVAPSTTYTSYISSSSDVDYYRFVAGSGKPHHLSLKVPADRNYDVYLYDSNFNVIATGVQAAGALEELSFRPVQGATYYIKVVGAAGAYGTGAYSFKWGEVVASYVYDRNNRLTTITVQRGLFVYRYDFLYDNNGNLLKRTFTKAE